MNVSGLASQRVQPGATSQRASSASNAGARCQASPCLRASASRTIQPRLCRVRAYWRPGFPRPTTSERDMTQRTDAGAAAIRRGRTQAGKTSTSWPGPPAWLPRPAWRRRPHPRPVWRPRPCRRPAWLRPPGRRPSDRRPRRAALPSAAGAAPRRGRGGRAVGGDFGRGHGGLDHDFGHRLDAGHDGLALQVQEFDAGHGLQLGELDRLADLQLGDIDLDHGRQILRQAADPQQVGVDLEHAALVLDAEGLADDVRPGTRISNFSSALTSCRSTWR